jgi:hypothetical protein
MKVKILLGTDPELYSTVASLVMDPAVLRQNDNYPFKTTPDYLWIIALDDNNACIGFLPMKQKGTTSEINNYYIRERDPEVMSILLSYAAQTAKKKGQKRLVVVTQKKDWALMEALLYEVEREFVKYIRFEKEL